jgi:hypothetical protein
MASAQQAGGVLVVASCGGQSLNVGTPGIQTVDTTGKLCTNAASSGSTAISGPLGPTTTPAAAVATTDTGTPITGQSISAGGQGLTGWLSQIYAAAIGPIPTQSSTVPIGGTSICDGANGTTNPCTTAATVKAASTAPALTDKALVVALSSNGDPCIGQLKSTVGIAITSATQTSLVAAVASKKVYICSLTIIAGAADIANFYDVAAAGACSAASTDAVIGANSNASTNGLSFAANGGLTLGNGGSTVAFTSTANSTLCVVTSGTGPLSGNLTYVQQ